MSKFNLTEKEKLKKAVRLKIDKNLTIKAPKFCMCYECGYMWYTRSIIEKPTCPRCFSHRTMKARKNVLRDEVKNEQK